MKNVCDDFLTAVTHRATEIMAAPGLATGADALETQDILARFRVKRHVLELLQLCVSANAGKNIDEATLRGTLENLRRAAWRRNVASPEVLALVEDSCGLAEEALLEIARKAA